jgi:hypothetical protein
MKNKNLNSYKIWSIRSGDWYNSERRVIFATKTKKERTKWIKYFRGESKEFKRQDQLRFKRKKQEEEEDIIGKDLTPANRYDILDLPLSGNTSQYGIVQRERKHSRLDINLEYGIFNPLTDRSPKRIVKDDTHLESPKSRNRGARQLNTFDKF